MKEEDRVFRGSPCRCPGLCRGAGRAEIRMGWMGVEGAWEHRGAFGSKTGEGSG